MTCSPLACILKEERLKGPNFIDWKRKLDFVLVVDKIMSWLRIVLKMLVQLKRNGMMGRQDCQVLYLGIYV